ncbi:MAG: c-type cytochrome [Saprospiraceae bacterium]|nr:c-type cytochrome [Saprospiraceae bacterium]
MISNKYTYVVILVFMLVIASCNRKPDNLDRILSTNELTEIQTINTISLETGKSLLTTHCFACHNPNSESHDDMLAPPMAGIKYKYTKLYPNEELFIAQMSEFIHNPTQENAVMKGPVRRFGLMPKTTLSKVEIQELVKFIYHNELETPKWFPAHFEEQHNQPWKN